jgi:hypothetical protein
VSDPIVDPDWLAREVDKITTDLELRFPASLPGAVRAAVNEASRRVSYIAKISNYLPVLIRRAAVEMLGILAVPPGVAQRYAAMGEND